jgi:hypothetical protein
VEHGGKKYARIDPKELGCGNVGDNTAVLARAELVIQHGNIEQGVAMLFALRDFILRTRETKSVTWVLPAVEQELKIYAAFEKSGTSW